MNTTDSFDDYRALRKAGRDLCARIFRKAGRDVIVGAARDLGLWKRGALVADLEETSAMQDRIIYDKTWWGRRAFEHFETDGGSAPMTDDELRFARAMRTARFSLFEIRECGDRGSLLLSDLLPEWLGRESRPPVTILDSALSLSAAPGLLLAARLLDAGGFLMTSGASFPFPASELPAIRAYLEAREFGTRRRRLDQPENYIVYFHHLHRKGGIPVTYEEGDA